MKNMENIKTRETIMEAQKIKEILKIEFMKHTKL